MIQPLRQRHRRVFAVLGFGLPIAFILGAAARRAVPAIEALPPELHASTPTFTATDWDRGDLFDSSPVRVRLWRDLASDRVAVGLQGARSFVKPDLLVYWIGGHPTATGQLPADATLLGAFMGGPLLLPRTAATEEGSLILYSLADQAVVAVSRPARFTDRIP
jgi:hypothetical protein